MFGVCELDVQETEDYILGTASTLNLGPMDLLTVDLKRKIGPTTTVSSSHWRASIRPMQVRCYLRQLQSEKDEKQYILMRTAGWFFDE